jgi:hypothetical protein
MNQKLLSFGLPYSVVAQVFILTLKQLCTIAIFKVYSVLLSKIYTVHIFLILILVLFLLRILIYVANYSFYYSYLNIFILFFAHKH